MTAHRPALPALVALLLTLLVPGTARAQEYSRFTGTFSLLNTQPVGELATGPGLGIALGGEYALDRLRIFRIHGEFRAAIYDHERREVCFSQTVGCRILLDLDTSYGILYAGLGPQIAIPVGPLTLALDGTAGWTLFSTTSSLSGVDDQDESFGETQNYDDDAFAWSAGGQLRIPVGTQFGIAVGGQYQHNGVMSYLREGGITDNPDGTVSFTPRRTEANLVAITLGVVFRPVLGNGSGM